MAQPALREWLSPWPLLTVRGQEGSCDLWGQRRGYCGIHDGAEAFQVLVNLTVVAEVVGLDPVDVLVLERVIEGLRYLDTMQRCPVVLDGFEDTVVLLVFPPSVIDGL